MLFINEHCVSPSCEHHVLGTIKRCGNNDKDNLSSAMKPNDSKINLCCGCRTLEKDLWNGILHASGTKLPLYDLPEIPLSSRWVNVRFMVWIWKGWYYTIAPTEPLVSTESRFGALSRNILQGKKGPEQPKLHKVMWTLVPSRKEKSSRKMVPEGRRQGSEEYRHHTLLLPPLCPLG